jgi:translation elongation factor EF-G
MENENNNKEKLKKLMDFFNSPVGKLYQLKGQLGTILLVLKNESQFRNPKISDVKENIKLILSELEPLPTKDVKNKLTKAFNSSSKKQIMDYLEDAEEDLFDIVNRITADFILKNKEVCLY